MNAKYKASSYWLFTGVLYLTIERAPIIPSDKYKLVDITFVTARTKGGNIKDVKIKFLFNKYL